MLVCWGIKFKNVNELWEHPRCYVSTPVILTKRLAKMPPEQAVIPDSVSFLGISYPSIYKLHIYGLHCTLAISTLYKRLGFIYNGKKLTPEQAACPRIWNRFKRFKRQGTFGTILCN
jgi:hypothetical protein